MATGQWKKHNTLLYQRFNGPPRPFNPNRRNDEDGAPPVPGAEPPRGSQQGIEWGKDWESWGRRVRRDILIIEDYLRNQPGSTFNPYGDPGDPPPPPDEEFIP